MGSTHEGSERGPPRGQRCDEPPCAISRMANQARFSLEQVHGGTNSSLQAFELQTTLAGLELR